MNKQELSKVVEKLENLDLKLKKSETSLVWFSLPYSEENIKIMREAIKKVKWNKNEYTLSYDENCIFVEKDLF